MAKKTAPQIEPFKGEEPQPAEEWEVLLWDAETVAEVEHALAVRDQMSTRGG